MDQRLSQLTDSVSMNEITDFVDSAASWNRLAERVGRQDWPAATLYVVATSIGNLGDLGLRAWQTLARCEVIAAEDTRTSRAPLEGWGVGTRLIAAHRHNNTPAEETIRSEAPTHEPQSVLRHLYAGLRLKHK